MKVSLLKPLYLLRLCAAELGFADHPKLEGKAPTPPAAPLGEKISEVFETIQGAAIEIVGPAPVQSAEPQATPTSPASVSDLVNAFRVETDFINFLTDISVLIACNTDDGWNDALTALHKASPSDAYREVRVILADEDLAPVLVQGASTFVHENFESIRLHMIGEGIDRYKGDPDHTLGRRDGLNKCRAFLDTVIDPSFGAGETAKLKQRLDAEIKKLASQRPEGNTSRATTLGCRS